MSGPKLIELRRMRAARERQQNLDRCTGFASEYARLLEQFRRWAERLAAAGLQAPDKPLPLEQLRARIDSLLQQGFHHEAARIFGEEVSRLRGLVDGRRRLFQERMLLLQNRRDQLARDCEAITAERSRLADRLKTAIPTGWPEEEKRPFQALVHQALQGAIAPPVPESSDDPEALANLEQAANLAASSLAILRTAHQAFQTELDAAHTRSLSSSLTEKAAEPSTSPALDALLRRFDAPATPPSPADSIAAQIPGLFAELATFSEDAFLQRARREFEKLRAQQDPAQRRLHTEALLLDCSARLQDLRRLEQQREDIQQLLDSAAHLADTAVQAVVSELRLLLASRRCVDLAPLRSRLQSAIAAAEAARERAYKRSAILDSLRALGYQTNEGLETALVKQGRLILRRSQADEYAVEMVADPDLNQLQTALVRFADSPELTEQQRRRDREREESWCQDHARLRRQMAARGLESAFRMQLKPGEHPVKVIVSDNRSAASRRKPVEKDLRREL